MEINVLEERGRVPVTIFKLAGRINMGNADQLIERARQAQLNGMRNLILDLGEVESMTSVGLRAMIEIYKLLASPQASPGEAASAEAAGKAERSPYLKLLDPSADLRRMLEVAGFTSYFEIFDDRDAAIRSF